MAKKPEKDPNDYSFFSLRGTHAERMPTVEEVFERNYEKMKKAQESIDAIRAQYDKQTD